MMGGTLVRCGLILLAFVLAQGAVAQAEVVKVRSGEHDGFSRLVIDLQAGAEWAMGHAADGYEFRTEDPATTFDIGGVYAKIPRTRLTGITLRDMGTGLRLTVGPGTHAKASQTSGGGVIIDIADGPAPEGSPFERPIDPPSGSAVDDAPSDAPVGSGPSATLTFRPETNEAASLPIYWRDVPGLAPKAPAPVAADEGAPPTKAEAPAILPPVIAPPPPAPPPLPSSDILALEGELRLQLSRAAGQGLADLPEPQRSGTAPVQKPAVAAQVPPAQGKDDPPDEPERETGGIAYHAETSVDRDAPHAPNTSPLTSEGAACFGEDDLDIRNWGEVENAADQISRARQGLVGEFDRPDSEAVRDLARLYLYFGMGAEAHQVLTAFGLKAEDTELIADLGQVMDDRPVRTESPLHNMRDCDTPAALWAFLAAPGDLRKHEVDTQAVIRAFSGFPPHLRLLLGRRLSDRLIAMGDAAAARAVRNALARQSAEEDRELGMIDAELAQEKGGSVEPDLDRLMAGNDDVALRATVLSLQSSLANGEPISADKTEAIAALAFEYRKSETGRALAVLEIAARAASGDFETAFLRHEEEREAHPDADHQGVLDGLFTALATRSDTETFLKMFFEKTALAGLVGDDARLALARRLSDLGFAQDVRLLLADTPATRTEDGELLLAEAALRLSDPAATLALTEGRTDAGAVTLRADALAARGEFSAAAQIYYAAGAPDRAAAAAWSAGDLRAAATLSEQHAGMLKILSPPPHMPPEDAPPNLADNRDRLAESASFRAALSDLLASTEGVLPDEGTTTPPD